jgi:hypothetical protein
MSKFVTNLVQDAEGIKKQRADILASETSDAQTDLIKDLEKQKRELNKELMNLTDLSPENAFDLRPGGANYNAVNWVERMQTIQEDLMEIQIRLNIALATQKEWFSEDVKA